MLLRFSANAVVAGDLRKKSSGIGYLILNKKPDNPNRRQAAFGKRAVILLQNHPGRARSGEACPSGGRDNVVCHSGPYGTGRTNHRRSEEIRGHRVPDRALHTPLGKPEKDTGRMERAYRRHFPGLSLCHHRDAGGIVSDTEAYSQAHEATGNR